MMIEYRELDLELIRSVGEKVAVYIMIYKLIQCYLYVSIHRYSAMLEDQGKSG